MLHHLRLWLTRQEACSIGRLYQNKENTEVQKLKQMKYLLRHTAYCYVKGYKKYASGNYQDTKTVIYNCFQRGGGALKLMSHIF